MEATQQQPDPDPATAKAVQEYGELASRIEQEHAQKCAEIDADYSRATQFAGLVRQELWNSAVKLRDHRLAVAYGQLVGEYPGAQAQTQEATHDQQD